MTDSQKEWKRHLSIYSHTPKKKQVTKRKEKKKRERGSRERKKELNLIISKVTFRVNQVNA